MNFEALENIAYIISFTILAYFLEGFPQAWALIPIVFLILNKGEKVK